MEITGCDSKATLLVALLAALLACDGEEVESARMLEEAPRDEVTDEVVSHELPQEPAAGTTPVLSDARARQHGTEEPNAQPQQDADAPDIPWQVMVEDDEPDADDPEVIHVPAAPTQEAFVIAGAKALLTEAGVDPASAGSVALLQSQALMVRIAEADYVVVARAVVVSDSALDENGESLHIRQVEFEKESTIKGDSAPDVWFSRISDEALSCGPRIPELGVDILAFLKSGKGGTYRVEGELNLI